MCFTNIQSFKTSKNYLLPYNFIDFEDMHRIKYCDSREAKSTLKFEVGNIVQNQIRGLSNRSSKYIPKRCNSKFAERALKATHSKKIFHITPYIQETEATQWKIRDNMNVQSQIVGS